MTRFFRMVLNERGELDFGGADVAVPLPATLTADPGFSSFKTVGDLAKGFKESSGSVNPTALNAVQGEKFHALLPEDIRTKPYMKDVNTFGDFIKKFDSAQGLIGARTMPADNADPKEWDAYFTRNGRPEKPEKYVIPEVDGVPKEFTVNMGKNGMLQAILFEGGVNQVQANRIISKFVKTVYAAEQEQVKIGDAAFNKTMGEVFGQDKDAIVKTGREFLATYVPDNVKPLLAGLDDKAMAVVLAATEGIVKKHVREDGFRGPGAGGGGGSAETRQTIQAKMSEIMKDPAYGDPFKDKAKHEKLLVDMEALRTKLRALNAG